MSEQICEHGKPIGECPICSVEKALDKKPEVIEIKHTFEGNPEDSKTKSSRERQLEEKLEQRESELAVIALKKFENDKSALLRTIEDEDKRNYVDEFIGDDPEKLESVKVNVALLSKALGIGGIGISSEADDNPEDVEARPPSGSAKAPPEQRLLTSGEQAIDVIYNTLENPNASEEQKAKARRKADEMIDQFIAGRREAIKQDPRHRYYVGYTMCPKCLEPIFTRRGEEATKCPKCGAVLTKRKE